jgi:fructokinase
MGHKLGIDLGGTKTEVVVLDPEGQTVYRQRVTTPADSYDAILDLPGCYAIRIRCV